MGMGSGLSAYMDSAVRRERTGQKHGLLLKWGSPRREPLQGVKMDGTEKEKAAVKSNLRRQMSSGKN